jgi:transposase InsO family protein
MIPYRAASSGIDPVSMVSSRPEWLTVRPSWWGTFSRGYGPEPERKRILLYSVLQRLCAAMGSYYKPKASRNEAWSARALEDLDGVMDEIENLLPIHSAG